MNVEEMKQAYKDQWVLAEVLEEDELNQPVNLKVLVHSKERDVVYKEEKNFSGYTLTMYTGEIPEDLAFVL